MFLSNVNMNTGSSRFPVAELNLELPPELDREQRTENSEA